MIVRFHKSFEKQFAKLRVSERAKFKERARLFVADPFTPVLNNHALAGKFQGYRSINVMGVLRVIYKRIDEEHCVFVAIGSHGGLYGQG